MALEPTISNGNKVIDTRLRRITTEGIRETTVPDEEIIKNPLMLTEVLYKRVTLYVEQNCTVIRNGEETLHLFGGGELVVGDENTPTRSLVIKEVGIRYFGIADY